MFIYYEINGEVIREPDDLHIYLRKNMPTAQYLYDNDLSALNNMGYREALNQKTKMAYELMVKLIMVDPMFRDTVRINKVLDAQKFNDSLVSELPKDDKCK